MPSMEPAISLLTCERALRQLFEQIFKLKLGDAWLTRFLSAEKMELIDQRIKVEQARRQTRGVVAVSTRPVDYVEFYDLVAIADKNWSDVAVVLGEKKATMPLLLRLESLRNTVAHSRELLPFEVDLMAGIAGEVRNRVAVYMSDLDEDDKYYPRIESAIDQFGNEPRSYETTRTNAMFVRTRTRLSLGDTVTFHCRGTDPHGRELQWWIQRMGTVAGEGVVDSALGDEVTLTWNVNEDDVAHSLDIFIVLASVGSRFHRSGSGYDQLFSFNYRVVPPAI